MKKDKVQVEFKIDQYSPDFGDKKKGDIEPMEENQAKVLEARNVVKILEPKKKVKK